MSSLSENQSGVEFNPYKNDVFSDASEFDDNKSVNSSNRMFDSKKTTPRYRLAKILLMVSVNLYDFVGLLEMLPCGTLHPTKPYISYKMI